MTLSNSHFRIGPQFFQWIYCPLPTGLAEDAAPRLPPPVVRSRSLSLSCHHDRNGGRREPLGFSGSRVIRRELRTIARMLSLLVQHIPDLSSTPPCHSTAHLILRFATDAESDYILVPHCPGLQSRLCASSLQEFFSNGLTAARYRKDGIVEYGLTQKFCADANLIALWANLGYVEEAAIRDHILQSLISLPELCDHQADAIIILFKLAGATFGAYADPSAVDRCFELLKHHYDNYPVKKSLVQVRPPCVVNVVIELRRVSRRYSRYESVGGRVSLPHLYSRPGSQNCLAQTRKTPLNLSLSHPWGFLTEISNLRSLGHLHPNRSPLLGHTQFLHLLSLSLRPPASPLCLTS